MSKLLTAPVVFLKIGLTFQVEFIKRDTRAIAPAIGEKLAERVWGLKMTKIVDVQIGQVETHKGKVILQSKAIGSCVAIVAYDATKNIGALAHVMLPGKAPMVKKGRQKTRYAVDAIDAMVSKMGKLGSKKNDIEVVLVGAANVLRREDDTICRDNIESILELLAKKRLKVKAQALGGTARRSVSLDIERGIVSCAEGNGSQTELWRTKKIPE